MLDSNESKLINKLTTLIYGSYNRWFSHIDHYVLIILFIALYSCRKNYLNTKLYNSDNMTDCIMKCIHKIIEILNISKIIHPKTVDLFLKKLFLI